MSKRSLSGRRLGLWAVAAVILGPACNGEDVDEGPRKFGSVELSFPTGVEVYLATVFALPTGAEVPESTGEVLYNLNASGTDTSSQALTLRRGSQAVAPTAVTEASRARYEVRRRRWINRLVEDLRARRRSLERGGTRSSQCSPPCTGEQICGPDDTCVGSLELTVPTSTDTITCDVVASYAAGSDRVVVLLDQAEGTNYLTAAKDAGQAFAHTLTRLAGFLGVAGHSEADVDGDGALAVVFTNHETDELDLEHVGFFYPEDLLPASGGEPPGNERDLLWARVPGTSNVGGPITTALAVGTLVHEYTHMTSFAVRVYNRGSSAVPEVLWLDEGLAHLSEDLTGWGASAITCVYEGLDGWPDYGFASSSYSCPMRGKAHLLLRYIVDQRAKEDGAIDAASAETQAAAAEVVTELLNESAAGFEHTVFENLGMEGIWHWLLAVYASGNEAVQVESANAYDYLPTAPSGPTGGWLGLSPYDDTRENARGDLVELEGPDTSLLSEPTEVLEDEGVPLSGNVYYVVTSPESGTFTLEGFTEDVVDLVLKAQQVQ